MEDKAEGAGIGSNETTVQVWHLWKENKKEGLGRKSHTAVQFQERLSQADENSLRTSCLLEASQVRQKGMALVCLPSSVIGSTPPRGSEALLCLLSHIQGCSRWGCPNSLLLAGVLWKEIWAVHLQGYYTILMCIPLGKVAVTFVLLATCLGPPKCSGPLTGLTQKWLCCSPQKPKY